MTHGGKRNGAGRKTHPETEKLVKVTIAISESEKRLLDLAAIDTTHRQILMAGVKSMAAPDVPLSALNRL